MARPLDYVLSEILKASDIEEVNPRILKRSQFLPHTDVSKRDLESYGGFSKLRVDAATFGDVPNHRMMKEARGVELRNNYVRKLERDKATSEYLSDLLVGGMKEVFIQHPIKLPKSKARLKNPSYPERLLTLLWSDLHFGLDVDPREVYHSQFNWQIAARRMAKCCLQAATWKMDYRNETVLQVVLNGDIIAGIIHLSESNIKELQEQIWGATAILAHALAYLRQHFGRIRVLCLPGNHDRPIYRGTGRALAQRWNSHAHSIFMGLKIWFREDEHVMFDIPMHGMGTYETPDGKLVFATHGDTAPTTSNVGKSLNVDRTMKSIWAFESSNVFDKKIEVVLFGHWHQPSLFMLPDGTTCIVNGCLIGSDSFAQNAVGFCNTLPAQIMFESVEGHPVGDFRVIKLRDADNDKAMDEIINIPDLSKGGLIDF